MDGRMFDGLYRAFLVMLVIAALAGAGCVLAVQHCPVRLKLERVR